jgi:predicted ATPase/class 3 adenylate cyclase/DNA-binding CsgD family transcriptional regulator
MAQTKTVTFLFTDAVSSTELRAQLGDDAADELFARHLKLLRDAVSAAGGREVKDLGDGLMAAFTSAADAVACGVQMQRAVAEGADEVRLRVGLHAGEAAVGERDHHGMPVVVARRLCDHAEGGQILGSELLRGLVGTRGGHGFRSLGALKLKGIRAAVPACEIVWREGESVDEDSAEGLLEEAADQARADAGPVRLARPLTTFVGRTGERAKVQDLLARHRLLTLTGPGGSGKTRLATEAARELADRFDAGARLVELAPLADPEQVPGAVATALGVREQPGLSVLDSLTGALAGRHVLLVLDNCEHVLDAAGDLAEAIINASDDVRILATSREPLGVAGEARYAVPPLPVPPAKADSLVPRDYAAVALFEQRAQQADPDFALTADSERKVAQIVQRLDGMPLAIELAAARVDVFGLDQLLQGLSEPLKMLVSDSRRGVSRQRSLKAAVDWSYRLLDEGEQRAFRRLSVFAGPFTLDAATVIAGSDSAEVVVARLVRRSLLTPPRAGPDGQPRYAMLQTLRAYASAQLNEGGEGDDAAGALAAWGLASAKQVAGGFPGITHLLPEGATGSHEMLVASWMDAEEDNVRTALEWMLEHDAVGALHLGLCLAPWWFLRGRYSVGRSLLARARASQAKAPAALLAAAEVWLGRLTAYAGEHTDALDHFARAAALARDHDPSAWLVDALNGRAHPQLSAGREAECSEIAQRALEIAQAIDYPSGQSFASSALGAIAYYAGDPESALTWSEAASAIDISQLNRDAARMRFSLLIRALEGAGDLQGAERVGRQELELGHRTGDRWSEADSLVVLALIELHSGRQQEAAAHIDEAMHVASETGDRMTTANCLRLAFGWAAERQAENAAILLGASRAIVEAIGIVEDAADARFLAEPTRAVQRALGPERMREAEERGAEMSQSAAVEFAESLLRESGEQEAADAAPGFKLSRRERELLALVADGLTDAQIARQLYISVKTVHSHLDRIRDKTGARRRPDLTRLALTLAAADAPAS